MRKQQLKEGVEVAKGSVSSIAKSFGISGSDAAKYLGAWGVSLVKIVGLRRALFGSAVVGGVVGGAALVAQYLRRRQARLDEESMDASDEAAGKRRPSDEAADKRRRRRRASRPATA
jgi:hypothetical protein